MRLVEPTKVCNGPLCNGGRKPWSEFNRTPTGGPRWVCAACESHVSAARQRERRAVDPEPIRAKARAAYHRRMEDPEWVGMRRAYQRDQANRRRRAKGIPEGTKRGPVKDRIPAPRQAGGTVYDATPFVAWLRTLGDTPGVIARACGMCERQVRALLDGEALGVCVDTVDSALLYADAVVDGLPVTLDDLYPMEEAAA